jgi:hypothetical protein
MTLYTTHRRPHKQEIGMNDVQELFRRHGEVEEIELDSEWLGHMATRATYGKHIVTGTEILEVHQGQPEYFLNASGQRAPIVMVGPTAATRFLTIPLEPTADRGTWRAVTAFESNTHHKLKYHQSRGGTP